MFSINKKLLPIKAFYFFTYAGLSPLTAYGPTLGKQLGLSTRTVGIIYFTGVILSIFGRLIFGFIADKFRLHKILLISVVTMCSVSVILAGFLPKCEKDEISVNFAKNNSSFISFCFENREHAKKYIQNYENPQRKCEINCPSNNVTYKVLLLKNYDLIQNSPDYIVHVAETTGSCLVGEKNEPTNDESAEINVNYNHYHCSIDCDNESLSVLYELSLPIVWMFLGVLVVFYVMSFIVGIFADTICFQWLKKEPELFGRQRMFASMGYGVSGLISGIITDYFSDGEEIKNYVPISVMSFLCLIFSAIGFYFFKMPTINTRTTINLPNLSNIIRNARSMVFALWCFLIGFYSAVVWQYSFWIIEDISNKQEKSWSKTLQGLMLILNTFFGDVPMYYFFGRIISTLGYVHCMTLTLLMNSARLFAYSIISSPVWALAISVLDGFTFGLSYAVITSYANLIARDDSKTTIQAFFNCIFDGIGTSFGGLCFGFVYGWYNGALAFRLCSLVAFISAAILATINFFIKNYYV